VCKSNPGQGRMAALAWTCCYMVSVQSIPSPNDCLAEALVGEYNRLHPAEAAQAAATLKGHHAEARDLSTVKLVRMHSAAGKKFSSKDAT
jgi:hypothetical protein